MHRLGAFSWIEKNMREPWSSPSLVVNLLDEEHGETNMLELQRIFEESKLKPTAKLRVLLAFFAIPHHRLQQSQLKKPLLRLLSHADGDIDEWVSAISSLLRRTIDSGGSTSSLESSATVATSSPPPAHSTKRLVESLLQSENSSSDDSDPYFEPYELATMAKRLQPPAESFERNRHFTFGTARGISSSPPTSSPPPSSSSSSSSS